MHKYLFLFFLCVHSFIWAQNQDSLSLSKDFKNLLVESNSKLANAKLSGIKARYFGKSQNHQMWYWTELSKYYIQTGNLKAARRTTETGLAFFMSKNNRAKQASFYNILGSIESLQKSYEKAIPAYLKSIELYDEIGNEKSAAYVKNNVANTFFSLSDYESAYKYISESYAVVKKINDTLYLPSIAGVLAISEVKLGKFESGKKHADECLYLSQKHKNVIGIIIGNYTLGEYYTEQKNYTLAVDKFEEAMAIATQYQQYFYVMLAKIGIAHATNEQKNYERAFQSGKEALEISVKLENQNVRYSIYKNLAVASFGNNQTQEAYQYLNQAHEIFRSNSNETNRKSINDILIQYETAKKEKTIIESRLKLQEETAAGARLKYLIGILSVVILGIILLVISQRKIQKQRFIALELQKNKSILQALIDGEEKERERISNEIHDGLASTITGIKIGLEANESNDDFIFSKAVNQLTKLHEETRRISHNLMPLDLDKVGLIEAVERFCIENSSPKTHLHTSAPKDIQWSIPANESRILYRIIQEIVHNSLKHAQAKNCSIQFQSTENKFSITIEDDGVGFEPETIHKNQGINAIEKRISNIGGNFQIESSPQKGCLITIELDCFQLK